MEIKVFKFMVSNFGYKQSEDRKRSMSKEFVVTSTERQIEEFINDFIEDKEVVDIKINSIDFRYHNNGGSNMIELYYTIMYK